MCGIVGFTGTQQAAPILLEGLQKLEYRGYDSAGIAVLDGSGIQVRKTSGKISNLVEKTDGGRNTPGVTGIGHTRWATHGAPTDVNAHPHISNNGKYAVVHNGIIENYLELRRELIKQGFHFESETDTEVIVHLLEMYDQGDVRKAILKTAARLAGSYALGVLCADEPGTIYAMRESSPLILGIGAGENYFASDVTAIVPYTKNAVYLEDGEFARITPERIEVFDPSGNPVQKKISRISWDIQAAEKGGFEHFMLKEIYEQPRAVKSALEPRIRDGEIVLDEFGCSAKYLKSIRKIIITACGSAYYAGCASRYAIEHLCGIPVDVELASELRYSEPLLDRHTLLIVISQSGETADTIAALKEGKARGAKVLAVVNVVGSTVAKLADWVLYTWAGPEIAVATTKGYTTQLTVLFLFALSTAKRLGRIQDDRYAALLRALTNLPRRVQQALDMNPSIPALAKEYYRYRSMFFIGRNTDYAAALEGALKMKEISYIHAECYAAGELKHGTIALIDDRQPVVAVCCNREIEEKTASNIVEVKARGAEVIAVAFRGDQKVLSLADHVLSVPKTETIFSPLVAIIPLQLLAYYFARENGCDIDKPKNLAKSVTVE